MLRPMVVATAAPVTPSRGNGPSPNTNSGPSRMLIPLASQSARMVMAASPAPRKLALIRNSNRTVTSPASMSRAYPEPIAITAGEAPIAPSSVGAKRPPKKPITAASPGR